MYILFMFSKMQNLDPGDEGVTEIKNTNIYVKKNSNILTLSHLIMHFIY